MEPRQVRNAREARAIVEERNLTHVKVGVFDVDGILRGKYITLDKFWSAVEKGFGFCDVIFGWDVAACPHGSPFSETRFHTVARVMRKRRPDCEMRMPE